MRQFLAVLITAVVAVPAWAEPIKVTDMAGRNLTIERPVERFVISEGRYISLMALLRPEAPVEGLVGMMSRYGHTQPELERQLFQDVPEARDIALFGNRGAESVSVEQIIDLRPQVAVFGLGDHGPGTENGELIAQLEAAGVTVIFIDFRLDPLNNTLPSIELLARVFGAEERAADYTAFYRERRTRIERVVAETDRRPGVFLQAHPGRFPCCWAMADGMLGPFVEVAGGRNISDAVAPGPTAQHTAEFLLTQNPEVWIGTASGTLSEHQSDKDPVGLGAGFTPEMARDSLDSYLAKPEFQALDAVREGRAHSVWHNFYNSPFNIVVLEAFAHWIHPERFAELDPQATLQQIYESYLPFELEGTYFATAGDE